MKKVKVIISLILSAIVVLSAFSSAAFADEETTVFCDSAVCEEETAYTGGGENDTSDEQKIHYVNKIEITDDDDGWYYDADDFHNTCFDTVDHKLNFTEYVMYEILIPDGYEVTDNTEWYLNGKEIPDFITTIVNYSEIRDYDSSNPTVYIVSDYRWFGLALYMHILNFLMYGIWF